MKFFVYKIDWQICIRTEIFYEKLVNREQIQFNEGSHLWQLENKIQFLLNKIQFLLFAAFSMLHQIGILP